MGKYEKKRYHPAGDVVQKGIAMIDLNDFIAVGQNAIARRVVQQSDASDNYDNDFKSLLATPRLIHWAIDASIKAIDPYLPDDYASIGLSVNFLHTAPTSLGMTVTVHASVIALTDHDVTLEVKAWDEQGEIGHGLHKRAIVLKQAVLDRAEERTRLTGYFRRRTASFRHRFFAELCIYFLHRCGTPFLPSAE